MTIVMCDLQAQYKKYKTEINSSIQEVLDTGAYIGGKFVNNFEQKMQTYSGSKHAIACANGTDAIQIALMALDIKAGDEVITSPFTFVATAETIALVGATPIYADIDDNTYNIDPAKIEAKITARTKAIIPVHIWGQSSDMDAINAIAKKHNLYVIEDNAQAFGAMYRGRKTGTMSDISTTSFYPAKNLGCYGDGGMIFTSDDKLAEKLRMICNHGSKVRYYHELVGVNSRLDSIQAQVLSIKLDHLDEENEARRIVADKYNAKLNHPNIKTQKFANYGKAIIHQFGILVKDRDGLINHLKTKNIPTAIHYATPLHMQPAFLDANQTQGMFPIAEHVSASVVNLPIHPFMLDAEIDFICSSILEFVNRA
jgi:UDP-2-acetamido-2-deoxy-ribo-hexuluronate aminotransferase